MKSTQLFQVLCMLVLFLHCTSADSFKTFTESSTFCFWTRSMSDERTHYVFLRKTPTSLALYDTIWDKNNSLCSCLISHKQSIIESYLSSCLDLRSSSFLESPDFRLNITELVEPDGPCQAAGLTVSVHRARDLRSVDPHGSVQQDGGQRSRLKLRRSKRAWMVPGTVWCGSGNQAANFSDLGVFEETDKCCREHDHCRDTIASFSFKHGAFNPHLFTLSHCDCDNRFRQCLQGVNSTVSNMVGFGFFNLLKMRCFDFSHRMKCTRRTWWGRCAFSELTQYAVIKGPTNYTDTLSETDKHTLESHFHQTTTHGKNQVTKNSEASFSIQANDSRSHAEELNFPVSTSPGPSVTTLLSRHFDPLIVPTDTPKTTFPQRTPDRQQRGKIETCESYRHLDSCHLQIPPLQEKFGVRNTDLRTLYHCNCTARLAQKISQMDEVDPVHSLLMDFVSQSCFTLPQSENCTSGNSCSKSQETSLIQHWRKETTEQRHLVDVKRNLKKSNLKRMNLKRSERKRSAVRLHKKCRRMFRKLHKPRVPQPKPS